MRKTTDAPSPGDRAAGSAAKTRRPKAVRAPVIGLESEFTLYVQDEKRLPEHVFRDPRQIVRERMIPRTGRSFHLPSGGALYFDTGVIEVATPIIELEPGCCLRAVRSLWEQIAYVRGELDRYEAETGSSVRLEGFSTHYNISIPGERTLSEEAARNFARTLTYFVHAPMMLLAANRLSTGIGVRPRGQRVEVTADFTPDPELMVAATTFAVAAALEILEWPEHSLEELRRREVPMIAGFKPRKHTSRKGFLARQDCFPKNPFQTDPNEPSWELESGGMESLRQIACRIAWPIRRRLRELSDRETMRHLFGVLSGRARSLLDFEDRPSRYEDVGRVIDWNRRAARTLSRSRYEKVIARIITHRPIRVGKYSYSPERMLGWYEVAFRNNSTGHRRVFNLDELVRHCRV